MRSRGRREIIGWLYTLGFLSGMVFHMAVQGLYPPPYQLTVREGAGFLIVFGVLLIITAVTFHYIYKRGRQA